MAVSIIDKTKEDVLGKYIQSIQFHNPHLLFQQTNSVDIYTRCTICRASVVIHVSYTDDAYKNIIDTINEFVSKHRHHYKNGKYLGVASHPYAHPLLQDSSESPDASWKYYTTYCITDNMFETVKPNSITIKETTRETTREMTITAEKTGRKFRRKKG